MEFEVREIIVEQLERLGWLFICETTEGLFFRNPWASPEQEYVVIPPRMVLAVDNG